MAEIRTARRYYFLSRLAAYHRDEPALEAVWRAKQEEQNLKADGVTLVSELPSDFPSRAALVAGGYLAVEDLDGADCKELWDNAGLNERQARAVIAAAAALI